MLCVKCNNIYVLCTLLSDNHFFLYTYNTYNRDLQKKCKFNKCNLQKKKLRYNCIHFFKRFYCE